MQTLYLYIDHRGIREAHEMDLPHYPKDTHSYQQVAVGGGFEVVLIRSKKQSIAGKVDSISHAACVVVQACGGRAGQLMSTGPCAPRKQRRTISEAQQRAIEKTIPMFGD